MKKYILIFLYFFTQKILILQHQLFLEEDQKVLNTIQIWELHSVWLRGKFLCSLFQLSINKLCEHPFLISNSYWHFMYENFTALAIVLYLFWLVIIFVMHIHIMCMWFICLTPKGFLQKFYLISSPYNKNLFTLYYASHKCFYMCYWSHKVS